MRFQSENVDLKFLRRRMDGTFKTYLYVGPLGHGDEDAGDNVV